MEVERKRSKGGFFHLFDWNGKSRRKLLSNNSELSEESKSENPVENLVKSPLHKTEGDDYSATSSNRPSGDFSSTSSVTSNEGFGCKAPGVIARLMGLDSLPTHTISEPSSTPYSGSCSVRVSPYERTTPNFWNEYQLMDHRNDSDKHDKFSSNHVEPWFHRVQNRPIERFQTEILPPKSAKPIPFTNQKILSPIRSPGFIGSKNAACIMGAAAKIIEASPQITSKGKEPSFGSSSAPMKIRDLKEKIEAARKVSGPQTSDGASVSVAKPLKGRLKDKNHDKSDYTPIFSMSKGSEKGCSNISRNNGKSISLTEQARVNVQRREGSLFSSTASSVNLKERNDVKRKQLSRTQSDVQRTVGKGSSTNKINNVLRQNNQKQNCISNRDHSTSKNSTMDQQGRKTKSVNGTIGLSRTINRVTISSEPQSKKTSSLQADAAKELPMCRRKNLPRKKRMVNEELLSGETVSDNSINSDERSVKYNVASDAHLYQDAEKMKKSMDVVSFTFTSPISRVVEKNSSSNSDPSSDSDAKSSAFFPPGFNLIGGDKLNVLLEKKLHELTCRVESSNCNIIVEGTSASSTSSLQNSVGHHQRLQDDLDKNILCSSGDFGHSSIDSLGPDWRRKWQLSEEMQEQQASSSSIGETCTGYDLHHPRTMSVLEPDVTSGSCTDCRNSTTEIRQSFSAQDQEVSSLNPESESLTEFDTEQSDSESSISTAEKGKKPVARISSSRDMKESTNWEFNYVKVVLEDAEIMFLEYALGQTEKVIALNAFNQADPRNETEKNEEDYNKLEQKLLHDCMNECLELRCGQLFVGSCKGWTKWRKLIQRKGWLAEEIYKDILGWKSIGNIMVDDLVDKDMSTKCGRWLEFGQEEFQEGIEIEKSILTSLVDEIVFDLLL